MAWVGRERGNRRFESGTDVQGTSIEARDHLKKFAEPDSHAQLRRLASVP